MTEAYADRRSRRARVVVVTRNPLETMPMHLLFLILAVEAIFGFRALQMPGPKRSAGQGKQSFQCAVARNSWRRENDLQLRPLA